MNRTNPIVKGKIPNLPGAGATDGATALEETRVDPSEKLKQTLHMLEILDEDANLPENLDETVSKTFKKNNADSKVPAYLKERKYILGSITKSYNKYIVTNVAYTEKDVEGWTELVQTCTDMRARLTFLNNKIKRLLPAKVPITMIGYLGNLTAVENKARNSIALLQEIEHLHSSIRDANQVINETRDRLKARENELENATYTNDHLEEEIARTRARAEQVAAEAEALAKAKAEAEAKAVEVQRNLERIEAEKPKNTPIPVPIPIPITLTRADVHNLAEAQVLPDIHVPQTVASLPLRQPAPTGARREIIPTVKNDGLIQGDFLQLTPPVNRSNVITSTAVKTGAIPKPCLKNSDSIRKPEQVAFDQMGNLISNNSTESLVLPNLSQPPPIIPKNNLTDEQIDNLTERDLIKMFIANSLKSNNKPTNTDSYHKSVKRIFSGKETDYRLFRSMMKNLFATKRIPEIEQAEILWYSLQSNEQQLVKHILGDELTVVSIDKMWACLDDRFDNIYTVHLNAHQMLAAFKPIENVTATALHQLLDVMNNTEGYYISQGRQPELTSQFHEIYNRVSNKLPVSFRVRFIDYCTSNNYVPCFISMKHYIKTRLDISKQIMVQNADNSDKKQKSGSQKTHGQTARLNDYGNFDEIDSQIFSEESSDIQIEYEPDEKPEIEIEPESCNAFTRNPAPNKPTYGKITKNPAGKATWKESKPNPGSFRVTKCYVCNSTDHRVTKCEKFRKMDSKARFEIVRKARACFLCLQTGHSSRNCFIKKPIPCGIDGCSRNHHFLLHPDKSVHTFFEIDLSYENETEQVEETVNVIYNKASVSLPVVLPLLSGPKLRATKVACLLDTGSTMCMIDKEFADQMKLDICSGFKEYSFATMNGNKVTRARQRRLTLSSTDNLFTITIQALECDSLDICMVDWNTIKSRFGHLKNVPFETPPTNGKVPILLGSNYPDLMRVYNTVKGEENDPIAVKTPLGWACYGPTTKNSQN